MDAFLHACIAGVNDIGRGFCAHAAGVFVQSGLLIVVLLSADLLLRHRVRATVRYWIWMLVIVKLLLPPTFSLPTGVGHWLGGYVALPASAPQPVWEVAWPHETPGQPVPPGTPDRISASSLRRSNAGVEAAVGEPIAEPGERLTWQGGAILLWGIGVLGFAGLVMRRVFFVRGLVTQGRPAEGDPVELLEECRRRMNIHRPVRMKLLPGAFSPAVCGLRRPTILLPETLLTRLAPDNLRAVLVHELAHIKRADLWVNCLQTILQVIYFYNPLVWLANAIVRRVREQAVDEMSLVALGAEARSYGNTLIDIAEMAFWRANPALRLVGVAESKKSLEGRIRHMITRPIPKNARVGVRGVFAIVALGAAVLPMAAARTQTPGGKFAVKLSNGATVELVGVCHWPTQNPVCWKADGSRLDPGIHPARWSSNPRADDYGFMVQVTGPDAPELSWNGIEGAEGRNSESDVVDRQGKPLPGCRAVIVSLSVAPAETTIRVAVAAGPWTTMASHNGNGLIAETGKEEGILWSPAFQDAEGIHVMASTQWHRDRATRIVAVDKGGVLHAPSRNTSVASGNVGQMTDATFASLKRNDIKEFQFQVRPYEVAEFEGVSLVPGKTTEVRMRPDSDATTEVGTDAYTTYQVDRSVADFPPTEDFSTPEAAYATINRIPRDDWSAWQKVSAAVVAERLGRAGNQRQGPADSEWAKVLLNARIREVVIWNMTRAAVIAELPQEPSGKKIVDPIDVRHLQLENGRWLNLGNSRFRSIEEAKTQFLGRIERETTVPEALRDPLRHAGEIKEAAAHLFERLRTADYADILSHYRDGILDSEGWKKFPTQGLYMVHTDYPSFALWCCTHFKDNPIVDVQLGEVFIGDALVIGKTGWPTVPYKLTLKDGSILAGNLPFNYDLNQGSGHWHGMEGIDWHLWSRR